MFEVIRVRRKYLIAERITATGKRMQNLDEKLVFMKRWLRKMQLIDNDGMAGTGTEILRVWTSGRHKGTGEKTRHEGQTN